MLVHDLESLEDSFHDHLDLSLVELVPRLNLVIELSSLQQFHYYIDRVLTFVNLKYFHQILVTKFPHDFYLFDEGFLPIFLTVCCFFWEGFDCVFLSILMLVDQIDWCEIPFPDFLDRLEQFVKSSLVELRWKKISPSVENFLVFVIFKDKGSSKAFELESIGSSNVMFFLRLCSDKFEDEVIVEHYFVVKFLWVFLGKRGSTFCLMKMLWSKR